MISWAGLKNRKLFQWAAAYMAGAWLVLQVLDAVGGILNLSVVFQRGILVALGFGLILTLVLAWYHGEAGRQHVSGIELILIAGVLVVAGVALNFLRGSGGTGGEEVVAGPGANPRSVAVLPFVDMSPEGDQEYFGDGIAEELLSTIGQVPDLVVSARTSSFAFKKSDMDVRQIGVRLGVATVVEGASARAPTGSASRRV